VSERADADRVAEDLADCRQRGLDWLDRRTSNQAPVPAAALQQLAETYVADSRPAALGRIAQIKILLQEGISAFARQGHVSDAELLRDLFFGESTDGPIKSPGELLRRAQQKVGDATETRFRERRTNVMRSFSGFLIDFASAASTKKPEGISEYDLPAKQRQQLAVTGYVTDNEHFIQLLTRAVNVTIVGITNERLTPMIQEALKRKRAGGRTDAFWDSLRIVFLAETLLDAVNDERERVQDPHEALRQRRLEAAWARRSVGDFLKTSQSTHWSIYECPYLPVLTGALLEFGDRTKVAHLLIRRPRQPTANHLYIELEDMADRFSAVFEDSINYSISADMIVPVGFPVDDTFHCTEARPHVEVLKDGSGASGWLPMVLVITPQRRGGHAEAMLQLRTQDNSARELNRLSHLSGHILQIDRLRQIELAPTATTRSFNLTDDIPLSAARRVVQEVTGDDLSAAMRPVATGSYLYPDKEHLFFYVFILDLPEGIQFPRRAEMHTFPLPELLAVRRNQVLRCAAELCRITVDVSERAWRAAAEVVALNLTLHDAADFGETIRSLAGRRTEQLASMAVRIEQLVTAHTSPTWVLPSREIQISGLAGWQHREFFSVLIPLYSKIGINGASDLLDAVTHDRRKSDAVARLASLYQDEHLMASMPIEL
jgi:hypothetical protein